jgi:hypothetical protein
MGNPLYILYDGNRYTIAGRSMEEVEREIDEALAGGEPHWLEVNYGEGRPSRARILITPGAHLALQQDNTVELEQLEQGEA